MSLSDKIKKYAKSADDYFWESITGRKLSYGGFLLEEDVKEAIQSFESDMYYEWKNNGPISYERFKKILLDNFGKELTE